MKKLRWLLLPFSLLYALVVVIRNWCYDVGWFKSTSFNLPVISVGNLAVGGAGKSPMTEYLVRLLKPEHQLATLSRGYGRKTKGFLIATGESTATDVGDEPAQFKHKFPDITVAVCEERVNGINQLKDDYRPIILDDAYQHRAVKPGLSILLFDYKKLDEPNLLLPAGDLREPFSGKMRADIIVVSKCPEQLHAEERDRIAVKVKPYPYQQLFFTSINYLGLKTLEGTDVENTLRGDTKIFLLTGIAGAAPLKQYLQGISPHIIHHNYADHHRFSLKNIAKLADEFSAEPSLNKVVITTEKDAERLKQPELLPLLSKLQIRVLPISIAFLNNGQEQFDQLIINYVTKDRKHSNIH
ncbi:tetraacyldisaccharide 4'-kinase [Mucilaginibacter polytrichastri]|uniref:Tetraacyldisaccharide 4'-kinase n=1 Tax=Mucilaginibacter polytrichastri TaxID=1302689 RepID=A0A1Q5ZSI3_9SPHI|nr:tetraacyldisaccharide 4'-kinase [Mucilaginibacter polytrichastri]OKS84731.1 Tetraacyldisaccharide 4'-kinase [Mucilaginibacter polytrichastri]SFT00969.1 lipid-A-disaccharide kinase [Mucilaginibacter polytrichastri]